MSERREGRGEAIIMGQSARCRSLDDKRARTDSDVNERKGTGLNVEGRRCRRTERAAIEAMLKGKRDKGKV